MPAGATGQCSRTLSLEAKPGTERQGDIGLEWPERDVTHRPTRER